MQMATGSSPLTPGIYFALAPWFEFMLRRTALGTCAAIFATTRSISVGYANKVQREIRVTLPEAHRGTLEIDRRLLDSYGKLPESVRQFYFESRAHFADTPSARFEDEEITKAAAKQNIALIGGPMLGDLRSDGVTVWLRPATAEPLRIVVGHRSFVVPKHRPGQTLRVSLSGLTPDKRYNYQVVSNNVLAEGAFTTAPTANAKGVFRLAFGSCFHKIGLHNPNLIREILARDPHAMMLLGDIAVDDRNNEVNMHRADYQLRDVSRPWKELVSQVPVYASWDDHDYFDNDLSGIPRRYNAADREAVRQVWRENWNNPIADDGRKGIYFNSRVGPVEIVMLDTRSCRDGTRRKKNGSYLGKAQFDWFKKTLAESTAPFKVLSSGTMWSDYVSNGKDSWGTWDKEVREELFQFIEEKGIGGVLLVSGDRHGARGFRIPRKFGFNFYEFEPATLGGVSGPPGVIKNCNEQLFGYHGTDPQGDDFIAFGEFTFVFEPQPAVTFRLIRETGEILEEHLLSLEQITPG